MKKGCGGCLIAVAFVSLIIIFIAIAGSSGEAIYLIGSPLYGCGALATLGAFLIAMANKEAEKKYKEFAWKHANLTAAAMKEIFSKEFDAAAIKATPIGVDKKIIDFCRTQGINSAYNRLQKDINYIRLCKDKGIDFQGILDNVKDIALQKWL